jgi:hypothetical protein
MSKRLASFGNAVCGIMVLLGIAGLYYSWNKSALLSDRGVLLPYVIASAVLFALYVSSFWLGRSGRNNLALVTVSVLLSVYVVEAFLWATGYSTDHYGAVRVAGGDFDTRETIEVIEDLRARNVDAWPSVLPAMHLGSGGLAAGDDRLYPLGGLPEKVTVVCNESGRYMVYESDEHGFHNPKGLYTGAGVDIAIVGDSFAQGRCVAPGEEVSAVLRREGYSVLNLGIGHNSLLLELAGLTEYALAERPRVVLWMYFEGNDLVDLQRELTDGLLTKYLAAGFDQSLRRRREEVAVALTDFVNKQWQAEARRTKRATPLKNLLKLKRIRTLLGQRSAKQVEVVPEFAEILSMAKERIERVGGTMYFVYLPAWARYALRKESDYLARNVVLQTVRELGIPIIDFAETVTARDDPLALFPLRVQGHYTAEGYTLLAGQIAQHLRKDGMMPGSPHHAPTP